MEYPSHFVAIFGGAVSGAEAANQLTQRGINVVIFEQNSLPYGKIEDGLPKWHVKLRDKEERIIDEKMQHPLLTYVPNIQLGRDIDFEDVTNWGFSAVLIATGAWRDRPLPIECIDEYVGKGLYYQNPFIYWFNHCHDTEHDAEKVEVLDDAIVVGGGLASIDVVKALNMLRAEQAFKERGIETNVLALDRGIDRVLEANNLSMEDLGVKGCTLCYRRRDIAMPLSPMAADTPELLEKAQTVRAKVLNNAMNKFMFKFQGNLAPVDKIVEDGRLVGLVMQETKVEDGKVSAIEGSEHEVRGSMIISSIGSIPELIPGVPNNGSTYNITDWDTCQVEGYESVFALGNAVTGRGNIKESFKHGNVISQKVMDDYLGWSPEDFEDFNREKESATAEQVGSIAEKLDKSNLLSIEKIAELREKVIEHQKNVNYDGKYMAWVDKHLPKRLENMVEVNH